MLLRSFLVASLVCVTAPAWSQNSNKEKEDELKPRLEKITTRDGVELAVGYFPSDLKKEAVPVILIHEWEGSAPKFLPLALALQKAGCAVVTPDLRGHGGSRTYTDPRGNVKEFDLSRMNRSDITAMLNRDIEAVKKFLKEENDKGRLNLNALTLVGAGEGAILAANYAAIDWNFPDIGRKKQSKDVRALVLVSPERNLQGFNYDVAARHPLVSHLPWLIVVGDGSSQMDDAEKLEKQLDRIRRGRVAGPLTLLAVPSRASGTELLRSSRDLVPKIVEYVKANVIDQQENFPWVDRSGD